MTQGPMAQGLERSSSYRRGGHVRSAPRVLPISTPGSFRSIRVMVGVWPVWALVCVPMPAYSPLPSVNESAPKPAVRGRRWDSLAMTNRRPTRSLTTKPPAKPAWVRGSIQLPARFGYPANRLRMFRHNRPKHFFSGLTDYHSQAARRPSRVICWRRFSPGLVSCGTSVWATCASIDRLRPFRVARPSEFAWPPSWAQPCRASATSSMSRPLVCTRATIGSCSTCSAACRREATPYSWWSMMKKRFDVPTR